MTGLLRSFERYNIRSFIQTNRNLQINNRTFPPGILQSSFGACFSFSQNHELSKSTAGFEVFVSSSGGCRPCPMMCYCLSWNQRRPYYREQIPLSDTETQDQYKASVGICNTRWVILLSATAIRGHCSSSLKHVPTFVWTTNQANRRLVWTCLRRLQLNPLIIELPENG